MKIKKIQLEEMQSGSFVNHKRGAYLIQGKESCFFIDMNDVFYYDMNQRIPPVEVYIAFFRREVIYNLSQNSGRNCISFLMHMKKGRKFKDFVRSRTMGSED